MVAPLFGHGYREPLVYFDLLIITRTSAVRACREAGKSPGQGRIALALKKIFKKIIFSRHDSAFPRSYLVTDQNRQPTAIAVEDHPGMILIAPVVLVAA
ncbi:hypothetical protein VVR12_04845 [Rothia sp. LK2588]|uniref:hypothetical protein n=1 Tax=Rothia sp. LK2588 TaxID=3114369 RepID=UPI0034CF04AA